MKKKEIETTNTNIYELKGISAKDFKRAITSDKFLEVVECDDEADVG